MTKLKNERMMTMPKGDYSREVQRENRDKEKLKRERLGGTHKPFLFTGRDDDTLGVSDDDDDVEARTCAFPDVFGVVVVDEEAVIFLGSLGLAPMTSQTL